MKKRYKNIVWDWNGTLLNDFTTGLRTLNDMLDRRGVSIVNEKTYKDIFGFPVIDFYHKVGFDMEKESFHNLSLDFVETYDRYITDIFLNPQVLEILPAIQQQGMKQYILSALKEDILHQMLSDFKIEDYFEQACGSDDIYASSKTERGQRMLSLYKFSPEDTLMIGDTLHDAEVAEALGFDCLLFAGGHNSEWRLREKAGVIQDFGELNQLLGL